MSTDTPAAVETSLPNYLAYFEVRVPVSDRVYGAEAVNIVNAYLYGGFSVVSHSTTKDYAATLVLVQGAFYGRSDASYQVQNQRDRFLSGLYGTSEPVFYGPTNL